MFPERESRKAAGKEQASSPASVLDTVFFIILLWGWAITGAYFWHLTKMNEILLPCVPCLVWQLPGELWHRMPLLFIGLLLLFPILFHFLLAKQPSLVRSVRYLLIFIFVIASDVNIIWGSAVL